MHTLLYDIVTGFVSFLLKFDRKTHRHAVPSLNCRHFYFWSDRKQYYVSVCMYVLIAFPFSSTEFIIKFLQMFTYTYAILTIGFYGTQPIISWSCLPIVFQSKIRFCTARRNQFHGYTFRWETQAYISTTTSFFISASCHGKLTLANDSMWPGVRCPLCTNPSGLHIVCMLQSGVQQFPFMILDTFRSPLAK